MENNRKCPKHSEYLRDKIINCWYRVLVLKKIVNKPGDCPIHHSKCGEIIFLSLGQKKDLP